MSVQCTVHLSYMSMLLNSRVADEKKCFSTLNITDERPSRGEGGGERHTEC